MRSHDFQLTQHPAAELPEEDLTKQDAAYGALFANPHFWAFTYHPDPFLRKALYKFLQLTLHKRADLVSSNLEIIANALLVKGLTIAQIGSVADLLDALLDLTRVLPEAWTTATPPKKRAAITLIQRFVARGSQSAGPGYWSKFAILVSALPAQILPTTAPGAKDLLHAIVDGICNGLEPRSHLVVAWGSYFSTCYTLLSLAEDAELTNYILDGAVYPVYAEYLLGTDPTSRTAIPYYANIICANGIAMAGVQSARIVALVNSQVWQLAKDIVLRGIKAEDGMNLKDVGQRWVELSAEIWKRTRPENPILEIVRASNVDVLIACVNSVVSGSGGRSDVAGVLENVLARFGDAVCSVDQVAKVSRFFFFVLHDLSLVNSHLAPVGHNSVFLRKCPSVASLTQSTAAPGCAGGIRDSHGGRSDFPGRVEENCANAPSLRTVKGPERGCDNPTVEVDTSLLQPHG